METATTRTDALTLLEQEHARLRTLVSTARRRTEAADTPPPEGDFPLRSALPRLKQQVLRYLRIESEILHTPLGMTEPPADAVGDAKTRCDVTRQLLERVDATCPEQGENTDFREAFEALADHLLAHLDATAETLFPLAEERGLDLEALGRRMQEEEIDEMPAATRTEDGRLDIGTGEDRSPTL